MNGDPEQNEEHPESRQQPENSLESIGEINRAIKDGDEKYTERLGILADLLLDVNASLEKIISIETSLENHLKEIRAGINTVIESANVSKGEKEIRDEVNRILFNRPAEWSAGIMAWLREYHGP